MRGGAIIFAFVLAVVGALGLSTVTVSGSDWSAQRCLKFVDVGTGALDRKVCFAAVPGTSEATPFTDLLSRAAKATVGLAAVVRPDEDVRGLAVLDRGARELARWAKRQAGWLDRHRPDPCYKDVHTRWVRGFADVRDGAKALREALDSWQLRLAGQGVAELSRGTQRLVGVDLHAAGARCAAMNAD